MSPDAAMERAAVNYYARDRVRRALMAFSDDHLADAYQALADADLEAKTTPNDRLVMETLIHRLCLSEAARGSGAIVEV
jgi:DNA polymerase III delta subunit